MNNTIQSRVAAKLFQNVKSSLQCRYRSQDTISASAQLNVERVCPEVQDRNILDETKPYSEVPGPKPFPLFGNTWRLLPVIGQYQISEFASVCDKLYKEYGKIVKLSNLVGRPDLLFIYDVNEIEKVYRQEGPTPFRPSMPCLVHYKSVVRQDFFGSLPGVVGVHGEPWREFRTKVQKPILQLQTVRKYIEPIEVVTNDFLKGMF